LAHGACRRHEQGRREQSSNRFCQMHARECSREALPDAS
jgi:hypothetical protein